MTEGDGSSARNFRSAYYEKLGFCGNDEKNYLDLLIEASPFDDEKLSELCDRPELDRKCIEAWKVMLGVDCGRKNPFDDYANVRRIRSEHFHLLKHHLEVLLKHNLLMKTKFSSNSSKARSRDDDKDQLTTTNLQNSDDTACKALDQNEHQYHNQNCYQHYHYQHHHHDRNEHHENEDKLRARADHARLITMMYLLETGGLDTLDIDNQLESQECRRLLSMATFFVNVADDLQEAFFLLRNFTNHIRNKVAS